MSRFGLKADGVLEGAEGRSLTQSRRTADLLFRRKMTFGASQRWSRCRPKADIAASVKVYFLHLILMDSEARLPICWGHSVPVTGTGAERLSRHPLELVEL